MTHTKHTDGSQTPALSPARQDEQRSQGAEYTITLVRTPTDLDATLILLKAYAQSLNLDLTFQDFANEVASLPGKYSPDRGGEMLLARNTTTGEAVGCIALRSITSSSFSSSPTSPFSSADNDNQQQQDPRKNPWRTAELKRLYVAPSTRKSGLGRRLTEQMIEIARERGYVEVKLDTLSSMVAAQRMYAGLGFVDVEPYCFNPIEGVRFLGLRLQDT